jgi:addiction module HigA family antidote
MSNSIQTEYMPDVVSPPGETLLEMLEERGMSQAELAERTGRPIKTISEIINAKTAITTETALQLEKVLGAPARFWINRERNYQEWKAREAEREDLEKHLSWMENFPIREMVKMGWIKKLDDAVSQLVEVLQFFSIASPDQWTPIWEGASVNYRRSPVYAADPYIASVWLRQGELEAQQIQCAPYDASKFRVALSEIRSLTTRNPEEFVPVMTQLCAEAGVAIVFVHELPRLRTSGATRWLTPTKALIQLSLLYKRDDQLWFTFFHEAGHILRHGKKDIFLEGAGVEDNKEVEADRFAADILLPPVEYRNFNPRGNHFSEAEINEFARQIGIAPGIVVGRLQHDGHLPMTHLNNLKRRLVWSDD